MIALRMSRIEAPRFTALILLGMLFLTNVLIPNCAQAEVSLLTHASEFFQPFPKDIASTEFPVTPELAEQGPALFFDPRVSLDDTVRCARFHQPSLYGTDARSKSVGFEKRPHQRNAQTIRNRPLQFAAHSCLDRISVEDRTAKSLLGKASLGNQDFAIVEAKIEAILSYQRKFARALPGEENPVTQQNWGKGIGAYERALVTPSPFDSYLKGEIAALSSQYKADLVEFLSLFTRRKEGFHGE